MKKKWKIFWIVCAVLAGAGAISCIAGIAMGADFSTFTHHFYHSGSEEVYNGIQSYEYEGGITTLEIDASAIEVNVYSTQDQNIKVDFYKQHHGTSHIESVQEGSTLKIDTNWERRWYGHKPEKSKIDIYIPATVELEKAEFDISAGKVYVKDVAVKNIELDADACEFIFEGMDVEEYNYDIDMSIGTLKIAEQEFTGINVEKYINNNASKSVIIDGDASDIYFR